MVNGEIGAEHVTNRGRRCQTRRAQTNVCDLRRNDRARFNAETIAKKAEQLFPLGFIQAVFSTPQPKNFRRFPMTLSQLDGSILRMTSREYLRRNDRARFNAETIANSANLQGGPQY
jgi:hypothetical protein